MHSFDCDVLTPWRSFIRYRRHDGGMLVRSILSQATTVASSDRRHEHPECPDKVEKPSRWNDTLERTQPIHCSAHATGIRSARVLCVEGECGSDQGQVREGLREVAKLSLGGRVIFLSHQPQVVP